MRGKTSTTNTPRKAAVNVPRSQQDSSLSYFVSITIPQPKIKIKIPKLLAKTMRKRFPNNITTGDCNENEKPKTTTSKPRKPLSSKVGSFFTNVFRNNKKQCYHSTEASGSVKQDYHHDTSWKRSSSTHKTCLDCGNPTFSQESSGKNVNKSGVGFKKSSNDNVNICGRCNKGVSISKGVSSSVVLLGRQESSRQFIRVSSQVLQARQRSRKVRSLQRKMGVSQKSDEEKSEKGKEEREASVELCKKRILMGGKCKPLSISGTLQYDKNGILLPDVLP